MVNREQEIFCAALERGTIDREAFLDAACAGWPEARQRVEALLHAAEAAGGFLAENVTRETLEEQVDAADTPMEHESSSRETAGARIGRYRLQERIGEGGFGVVYRAAQEKPVRREVALKIIKLGMDTRAVVARFEAERQALALMEHPNIARVFDGGATDAGRPYFVMELVRGVPITTFCNERRATIAERLELFLQVCRAVHHAHQKGIIHRDLKPSNILVTLHDERPVVKVIDFGIAKAMREPLTEKTLVTRLHVFVGTPAYMSPEQVGLGAVDVDTRSDIYSLGALLYELLAGVPVLDSAALLSAGYAEVQRAIHHVEAPPPAQRVASLAADTKQTVAAQRGREVASLLGELRGDLDRIVLKCLEKDRTRRYETTDALARDIVRYLRHEPVLARPATLRYRAAKFVRRHRRGVWVGATLALVLAASAGFHTRRLATERDRAQGEARKAEKVSELLTEILTSSDPFRTPSSQGMLAASAARVRQEFAEQPDVRAEILQAIGRVHLRRGDLEEAGPILSEAVAAARAAGGNEARLALALSDLGILLRERGDYAGSVPLLEEALALRRSLHGTKHNDVAISLVELGRTQRSLERFELAEPLFREALAVRRAVLGEVHRETATSLGDLAVLLWQKGEFEAAEPCFEQSIALHRRTVGPEHANVGQSFANLAWLKMDQGEFGTAEKLLGDGMEITRRAFGEGHWRVARMKGQLAEVRRRQGRMEEAAAMLEDVLPVAREALGAGSPDVARMTVGRARVHLDRGEAAAAEPLLREALRVQQRLYLPGGIKIAATKSLLGAALLGQGRLDEAEMLLREANAVLPEVRGPQGWETRATRQRLAELERRRTGP